MAIAKYDCDGDGEYEVQRPHFLHIETVITFSFAVVCKLACLGLACHGWAWLFYNWHSATAFLCIHFHFFSFSLVYFCLNWNSSSPRHSAHSAFGTCVNIINNVQFPHRVTIKSSLSFMDFWQSKWNNNCWNSFLRLETIIIRMLQSHRVYIGKSGLRTADCKRNTHRRLEIIIIRLNESRKWY